MLSSSKEVGKKEAACDLGLSDSVGCGGGKKEWSSRENEDD